MNDEPSSNVILLPDVPEVCELLDEELGLPLAEELPCFFPAVRATGMAMAAAIKTKADRGMSKIFFLHDVSTIGAWRVR
jgi:hypothetical protein